jgi:hypothetical protein
VTGTSGTPAPDPAELVIRLEMNIRFNRRMTDRELAASYFRQWNDWSVAKQGLFLDHIAWARRAAEIAEMEGEFQDS